MNQHTELMTSIADQIKAANASVWGIAQPKAGSADGYLPPPEAADRAENLRKLEAAKEFKRGRKARACRAAILALLEKPEHRGKPLNVVAIQDGLDVEADFSYALVYGVLRGMLEDGCIGRDRNGKGYYL